MRIDAKDEGLDVHDFGRADAGEGLEDPAGGGGLGGLAFLVGEGLLAELQGLADPPLEAVWQKEIM